MDGAKVEVVGLDQFRRELRKLGDSELQDQLKDANQAVAQLVVGAAQTRAFTPLQRKAAQSLSASRAARGAQVLGGGSRFPFFGGAEFGAAQNQPRMAGGRRTTGWNQFEPWRGSGGDAGYFLYPAIRDKNDEIVDMYGEALEKISAAAFPS